MVWSRPGCECVCLQSQRDYTADIMLRSWASVVAVILPTLACSEDLQSLKPSALDAACESSLAANAEAPIGACKFAHGPITLKAEKELLNVRSERLSAPPGGQWWLAERHASTTLIAQSDSLGPVELEVVENPSRPDKDFTVLRVPQHLAAGTRLQTGCRQLVVEPAEPAFDTSDITLQYAYRPDLGGTGFVVRASPALRKRVYIEDAYIGPPGANVIIGLHVLHGLLLADAPSLCGVAQAPETNEIFVPMWGGETETDALAIRWHDADDFTDNDWTRLCSTPSPRCPSSTE
jgi:hypothetical protein